MLILPSRNATATSGGLTLPSRTKSNEVETAAETTTPSFLPPKKTYNLPNKKEQTEVEAYNEAQNVWYKKLARVLLPKKYEADFGVELIEPGDPEVLNALTDGWENLTSEQQEIAKDIFQKELPTAQKNKISSFAKSMGELSAEDLPYIGSGLEAVRAVDIVSIYNKVKKGTATDQEIKKLNDYYDEQERQAEEMKNIGYKVGETIKGSARFMGELLPAALLEVITGSIAPSGEAYAASKLTQKGTLEVIEKILKDSVTRGLVKSMIGAEAKTVALQFAVTAPTNITAGTAERMIGVVNTDTGEVLQEGQSIGEALVNATTGHAVELLTERMGGVSGKVLSKLSTPVKNYAVKTAIVKALQKKLPTASESAIETLVRKAGWNGIMGEWFEERDADLLNQALYSVGLGDQKFEGLTKEDVAAELIAFATMGVGVKVGTTALEKGLEMRANGKEAATTKETVAPMVEKLTAEILEPSVMSQDVVGETQIPEESETSTDKSEQELEEEITTFPAIIPTKEYLKELKKSSKKYLGDYLDSPEFEQVLTEFLVKNEQVQYKIETISNKIPYNKILKAVKNSPGYIKEGEVGDSLDAGFMMKKGDREVAVPYSKKKEYLAKGYSVSDLSLDAFASAAGYERAGDLIEEMLSLDKQMKDFTLTKQEKLAEETLLKEDENYANLIATIERLKKEVEQIEGTGDTSVSKKTDTTKLPQETELTPLHQEAKGKSLEEFVKTQGTSVLHGTSEKFETFSDTMKGSITGAESAKGAIWFTDSPEVAKAYSIYAAETGPINKLLIEQTRLEKIAQKSGLEKDWKKVDEITQKIDELGGYEATYERRKTANVKNVVIKGDFYKVDAKGKTPQELSQDDDIDSWLNEQLVKAKKLGKDGVIFKNLDDAVGLYNKPSTHYAIFDSKNIKTKSQLEQIWREANAETTTKPKLPKKKPTKPKPDTGVAFSTHYERIKNRDGFEELGIEFDPITLVGELQKAYDFIQQDLAKALQIAYNVAENDTGINSQAIRTSLIRSFLDAGDKMQAQELARILSKEYTLVAQTLVLARTNLDESTQITKEIMEKRKLRLGEKLGKKTPEEAKEAATKEIKARVKKRTNEILTEQEKLSEESMGELDKLINSLIC